MTKASEVAKHIVATKHMARILDRANQDHDSFVLWLTAILVREGLSR